MHASDEPIVDVPMAFSASGAFQRLAIIFQQRVSIAAVWGYSSLSTMFLSADSRVQPRGERVHPGPDERRQVEAGVAVEHGLVVDDLVRRLGQRPDIRQPI